MVEDMHERPSGPTRGELKLEALVRRALLERAEMHEIEQRAREISLRITKEDRGGIGADGDGEERVKRAKN